MQRNIRLTVEYHGGRFHGWQRQPDLRTVQGELESALSRIVQHPITLYAAGRTVRGVHALGQVANFATSSTQATERLRRGANALTGKDLVVCDAAETQAEFHARHSARGRHYLYLLLHRRSALWDGRAVLTRRLPDVERMNTALSYLVGEHDFAALSCRGDGETSTRSRVFYACWQPWARGHALRIGAARFLYKMVRCIVALSLRVGFGIEEPSSFAELLARSACRGEKIAPAHGLYLASVDYEDGGNGVEWGPDCLPPWPVI